MPFIALDKKNGQRVDITREEDPRDLRKRDLSCPLCDAKFIVVAPVIGRSPHFRHEVGCVSDIGHHPESYEHDRTKIIVRDMASEWFESLASAKAELEVVVQEANRRADVMFIYQNGWRVACEVQLAGITVRELQQRTNDYLKAGVDVIWFFGKSAATNAARDWSIETFGFYLQIEYLDGVNLTEITKQPISLDIASS